MSRNTRQTWEKKAVTFSENRGALTLKCPHAVQEVVEYPCYLWTPLALEPGWGQRGPESRAAYADLSAYLNAELQMPLLLPLSPCPEAHLCCHVCPAPMTQRKGRYRLWEAHGLDARVLNYRRGREVRQGKESQRLAPWVLVLAQEPTSCMTLGTKPSLHQVSHLENGARTTCTSCFINHHTPQTSVCVEATVNVIKLPY